MLAARITAPRTIDLLEVPDVPCRDGEVRVRLELACLCGSDLPYFAYDFDALRAAGDPACMHRIPAAEATGTVYPLPTGLSLHECVGTVAESRSDHTKPGDFVLALPFHQVGFFEYLTLPANRVFPLPASAPVSRAELLLSQPLGTVLHAFRKLPDVRGMTVAVVGQGPIGLMFDAVLALQGAARIIGVEKIPERRALARQMGAHATIDPLAAAPAEALAEETGGAMADLVIEAVGHRDFAIDLCVDLAAQDGWILQFGVIDSSHSSDYPSGKAFRKNLTIAASVGASRAEHFLPAAELIATRRLDLAPLITHRFPVREAQRAYETFVDRVDGAAKVLLDFQERA